MFGMTSKIDPNDSFFSEKGAIHIHENESKEINDHFMKKENLQRVINNPQKQKQLQLKLMQQMTQTKQVQVNNNLHKKPIKKVAKQKPETNANKQFESKMQTIKAVNNIEE